MTISPLFLQILCIFFHKSFTITPGAGGTAGGGVGGGGGGILIDSAGPPPCSDTSYPETHGEGYGGGGSYYCIDGFDGVVILDFL